MKRMILIAALLAVSACAQFDDAGHRVITERNHTSLTTYAGAFDLGPCKATDTRGCGQGIIDGAAIKADIATGNVVWIKSVDGGALAK